MAKKKNPQEGLFDELESIAEIDEKARLYMPALSRIRGSETPTEADMQDAKIALKLLQRSVRARNARSELVRKLLREGKAREAFELVKKW